MKYIYAAVLALNLMAVGSSATTLSEEEREEAKTKLVAEIDKQAKLAQVMNDMIFSFGELGFQEVETSAYLTAMLAEEGFDIEKGIAGIPTAWYATWGSGKPVIALGTDLDGIPKASQKPGVAYHDPIVEGAPGHGEGHNSGQVVNIIAALAMKEYMTKNDIEGTIVLWPGIAEEQLATKAYYVREGYFDNVDAVLYSHVGNGFGTFYGNPGMSGMVSVKYNFYGESAHSAGSPWRGRSALDAVELMSVGMNYRREHLRLAQRTHSVIVDGGDQPNVVPQKASSWYFFRETDYPHIKALWEVGDKMAEGAAMMSNTTWDSVVMGTAWPGHFNKPLALAALENIKKVGMPEWSDDDIKLAKALQKEIGAEVIGLAEEIMPMREPPPQDKLTGGGSDDVGDIAWTVPTIFMLYPANIPNLPGHNWANAVSMATPIAHKGIIAGAKAHAMNMVDLFTNPELLPEMQDYFDNVQTNDIKYESLLREGDTPQIHLNEGIMKQYREKMKAFYYNPDKYDTYLEQLNIDYPMVRDSK
ncbi:MAG: aminobenzoyl-glutamate utilization protein B [Alteromonadaceae bacterium]|jgi:aminobenzoyl-glutamate utilization protein B|uniref:peptidase dimerization domain-containing protein n=1 Tax=uncultured Alteromonas sp. TaxID=179113 RepID=UPI000C0FBF14|nr:MAG: amidohydrolase [Alteromonas sp.]|tara:strand:- start:2549 stop:4138 length:1590 start_codon:yes stop_codon:yes gene_type:complete